MSTILDKMLAYQRSTTLAVDKVESDLNKEMNARVAADTAHDRLLTAHAEQLDLLAGQITDMQRANTVQKGRVDALVAQLTALGVDPAV